MGSSCAASCTSVWGTRRRSAAPAPLPRGCAPPPAPTSTTCARSEAARRNATNRGGRGDAAVGADRVRADPHAPHRRVPASRRDHRPTGGVGRVAGNIKRPSSEPRQTIFYKLRDTSPDDRNTRLQRVTVTPAHAALGRVCSQEQAESRSARTARVSATLRSLPTSTTCARSCCTRPSPRCRLPPSRCGPSLVSARRGRVTGNASTDSSTCAGGSAAPSLRATPSSPWPASRAAAISKRARKAALPLP